MLIVVIVQKYVAYEQLCLYVVIVVTAEFCRLLQIVLVLAIVEFYCLSHLWLVLVVGIADSRALLIIIHRSRRGNSP